MRLLVDEWPDHRYGLVSLCTICVSAKYAGLAGLKNGHLLDAAEGAGFAVPITADRRFCIGRIYENAISILVLCGPTNRRADLEQLIPAALRSLALINPREVVEVRDPLG